MVRWLAGSLLAGCLGLLVHPLEAAEIIAEHPKHPLVLSANTHLANLVMERGRIKTEQAALPAQTPGLKTQLLIEARGLFQEAQKTLTALDAQLVEKHREYKFVDPKNAARIEQRDRIQREILQTRITLAALSYEIGRTFEAGSTEQKDALSAAATLFGATYKTYSPRLGAYYARIGEARCYKELGDYARAFEAFDDLLAQGDDSEGFRRMRSKATALAMETALLPQVKRYKEALDMCRAWEKAAHPRDRSSDEGPAIKCLGGEAALECARGLKTDDPSQAKEHREYLNVARGLLTSAAQAPGEFQQRARVKLSDALLAAAGDKVAEPQTFEEARDRAKTAWDQMQVPGLKEEEVARLRDEALKYFRFALAHPARDAGREELNTIRYCLAYLNWAADNYYEAVVLGEFLARRYPDRPEAQQGASIALAAYAKLFADAAAGDDRRFESDRMVRIAHYVTEHWPNSPGADEAWTLLVRIAATNREPDKAADYLAHVSADSPRRGEAQLAAGQALWGACIEAARLPEEQRPAQADMIKMIAEAQRTLDAGIRRLRKPVDAGGRANYSLVAATLSLAQICLDRGQPDQAVQWLDDPKIGPHALIGQPVTDRGNFRVEALKAALRAYVAAGKYEAAEQTLDALEKAGDDANLTRIYISLGRQLEESLKRIRAEGKNDEAAKVARGFELFLARISGRPAGKAAFNSLNLAAEMFMSLGASLDHGGAKPPPEAQNYYGRAADTYRKIIALSIADEKFAPHPAAITAVQIRLAVCLRRLGLFENAMETLAEVLDAHNTLIDAQREAACTYQAWGEVTPGYYLLAVTGGRKTKRADGTAAYLVWGWEGICRRVQDSQPHEEIFHDARYNLALCRFKYAQTKAGQERIDLLKQAQRDILVIRRLHPEMGGRQWYDRYNGLLKNIDKVLGEREQGLKGAENQHAADTKKEPKESGTP
jgi:tetratricopeptide (TPR) repeat protein